MLLDRFPREFEKLPQALQGAFLHAVLVGQRLGDDARPELGEELVGGGLVRGERLVHGLPAGSTSKLIPFHTKLVIS